MNKSIVRKRFYVKNSSFKKYDLSLLNGIAQNVFQ